MPAQLIAYPPEQAAIVLTVRPGDRVHIGRARDNALAIEHASVSRRHASLEPSAPGWRLRELDSKNGTFVEGHRAIGDVRIGETCWLRFGDVHCRFALVSDSDLAADELGRAARRAAAPAHTAHREKITRLDDLLDASLRSVLDLSGYERGFLLLSHGEDFSVRASQALDPNALPDRAFSGSVGAVRRVLEQRHAFVANDVARDAALAARDSVVARGLRGLLCLPLLEGDRTLGAIYADRTGDGPAITTLDLELLQAFAEHAAVWIAARRATEQLIQGADLAPRWSRIVAAQAEVA